MTIDIRWRQLESHDTIWVGWIEGRPLYIIARGRKGWHRLYLLTYESDRKPLGSYMDREAAEAAALRHHKSLVEI